MTQPQTNAQLAYSLGAVTAGLQQMQASAASGTLVIEKGAGDKLEAALRAATVGGQQIRQQLHNVASPAQLGANAVSTSMTQKFVGRADGDATSLGPLLATYLDIVDQMRNTVSACMRTMGANEDGIAGDLSGHR